MKSLIKAVIVFFLFFSFHNQAYAGDRSVNGLIIGGGAGAIMGQAIGRNVEATVLGATVGGILGAVIASGNSHNRHHNSVIIHDRPRGPHGRHFNYRPRHNGPLVAFSQPHNNNRKHYKKKRGHKNVRYNNCKPRGRKLDNHGPNRNESRDRRHHYR